MAQWCANEIWPCEGETFGNCTTMGVLLDKKLVAVVVFHNWQPNAGVIELSAAAISKRWLNRRVLRAIFRYCFERVEAQIVVLRTSPNDEALSRILKSYGFRCHRIPRLRGRHEDELINTLTDDDWKTSRFERQSTRRVQDEPAT
jgi:RimJ/RimL family protein N-acetyltransferase